MFLFNVPLFESKIYNYKLNPSSNSEEIEYNFTVDNLYYSVYFDKSNNPTNSYHVTFSFTKDGEESENPFSEKAGLLFSHLVSVLDTVCDIAKQVVLKYKPDIIAFSGDDDSDDEDDKTRRSKIYQRYLQYRYPSDMYKIVSDNEVYFYANKIVK